MKWNYQHIVQKTGRWWKLTFIMTLPQTPLFLLPKQIKLTQIQNCYFTTVWKMQSFKWANSYMRFGEKQNIRSPCRGWRIFDEKQRGDSCLAALVIHLYCVPVIRLCWKRGKCHLKDSVCFSENETSLSELTWLLLAPLPHQSNEGVHFMSFIGKTLR